MSSRQRYQYGSLTRRRRIQRRGHLAASFYTKLHGRACERGVRERLALLPNTPREQMRYGLSSHFGCDLTCNTDLGGQPGSERLRTITLNRNCLSYATQHSSRT